MKKIIGLFAVSALALVFNGCKEAADTHDADVKAIQDNEVQWVKDYAAKDVTKIMAHYTDDATVMMSNSPSITGKDAILAAMKKMTADPLLSVTFHSTDVDVSRSGDIGYSQGKYAMTTTDPITKQLVQGHGDYLTVYRKQADGSWKAVDDVVSSEVPPPAPSYAAPLKQGKAFHATPFD